MAYQAARTFMQMLDIATKSPAGIRPKQSRFAKKDQRSPPVSNKDGNISHSELAPLQLSL
jgi:hypothetical protein